MSELLTQPGKAYFPIDYRAVVFSFATETAQALVDVGYTSNMGFVSRRAALSGPSHGYFAGGSLPASQTLAKVNFVTNLGQSVTGFTRRHPRSLGASNAYRGYVFGGTTTNEDKQGVLVDKVDFATDAIAVAGTLLTPDGNYQSELWSQVVQNHRSAFLRSGPTADRPNLWSEYDLFSDSHAALGAAPSENHFNLGAAISGPTHGYVPIHPTQGLEKFSYASKTASVSRLTFPTGVSMVAAASGPQKGYWVDSSGRTRAISYMTDVEIAVSTALQDTVGTAIVSSI